MKNDESICIYMNVYHCIPLKYNVSIDIYRIQMHLVYRNLRDFLSSTNELVLNYSREIKHEKDSVIPHQ